jgi:hypothetical protein
MSAATSPFRRDGSVERRVTCAPPDVALRVIARDANPGPAFLVYLVVLAAGATACAAVIPGAATAGASSALLLLGAAALLRQTQRRRATRTDAQRETLPLRLVEGVSLPLPLLDAVMLRLGETLRVAVRFEAELAEGASGIRETRERWTFEREIRSSDPTWLLSSVAQA